MQAVGVYCAMFATCLLKTMSCMLQVNYKTMSLLKDATMGWLEQQMSRHSLGAQLS